MSIMNICVCTYVHTYIYTYTYRHIHTYMYLHLLSIAKDLAKPIYHSPWLCCLNRHHR